MCAYRIPLGSERSGTLPASDSCLLCASMHQHRNRLWHLGPTSPGYPVFASTNTTKSYADVNIWTRLLVSSPSALMLIITENFQHLHHFSRAPLCAENSNGHNGSDLDQHRCSNVVILGAEHGYSCCMSTDIAATGPQVCPWFRLCQY